MRGSCPHRVLCGAGQDYPRLLLTKVGSSVSVQVPREQLRRAGRLPDSVWSRRGSRRWSAVLPFWTRLIPLGRQRRRGARDLARTVSLGHLAPLFKQARLSRFMLSALTQEGVRVDTIGAGVCG